MLFQRRTKTDFYKSSFIRNIMDERKSSDYKILADESVFYTTKDTLMLCPYFAASMNMNPEKTEFRLDMDLSIVILPSNRM